MHPELHDAYIIGVRYAQLQFILDIFSYQHLISRPYRYQSPEKSKRVDSRMIFTGVTEPDTQKMRGRTLLTRKPKFYKTARDLLTAEDYPSPAAVISRIEHPEDGYIIYTVYSGDFYIKASGAHLEDWVEVNQM